MNSYESNGKMSSYVCIKDLDMSGYRVRGRYETGKVYQIERITRGIFSENGFWMSYATLTKHFRLLEDDITIKINSLLEI